MTAARWAGIAFQAMVLGTALFFALGKLIGLSTGARLFRYQAF